jgi:hypothetical protein
VELTAASSPKLKACVYHLFVVNNSTRSTSFSLTATITGGAPKFNVGRGGKGEVDDGTGEILVMNRKLTGTGDSFVLRSLSVTDLGVGDMGRVEKGVLYADSDGSDSLTPGDRVLQEVTEIDRAGRRIVFSGLHEVFEADLPQTYLLTYTVRATSGGGIFLSLLLAGLAAAMWRSGRRGVGILLLTLIGLSCASEARQFHPTVTGGADVSVVGETFGDEVSVTVQSLTPTSVKDYFE